MFRENEANVSLLELAQLCQFVNYTDQTLPDGWSKIDFFDYTWHGERNQNNIYRYIGFKKGSNVVCVFAGNDVTKDAQLLKKNELHSYFQDGCNRIENDQSIVDQIRENTNIIMTGYSIGAALAEIAGCFYGVKTITFESPGCSEFLAERARDIPSYQGNYDITTLLTKPNVVNTINKHFGEIMRLRLKHVDGTSYWHMAKAIAGEADRVLTYFSLGTWAWGTFVAKTATAAAEVANAAKALAAAEAQLSSYVAANGWRKFFNNRLYWRDINKLKQFITQTKTILHAAQTKFTATITVSKVTQTATTAAGVTTVIANSSVVLRKPELLTDDEVKKLINQNQHGLERIIEGLILRQKSKYKPGEPGTIFGIKSWPTSTIDSWSKCAKDILRSKLPLQKSNAGVLNFYNEDSCHEAKLENLDDYSPKM